MRVSRVQKVAVGFAAIGLVGVLGACGGGTTISTSGNDGNGNSTSQATLPSDWPSSVPTPDGLTLKNALASNSVTNDGRTFSGTWQGSGNAQEVYQQMTGKLKTAGWTSGGSFGGESGGSGGGVSAWTMGQNKLQLTVANQDNQVVVNETAIMKSS